MEIQLWTRDPSVTLRASAPPYWRTTWQWNYILWNYNQSRTSSTSALLRPLRSFLQTHAVSLNFICQSYYCSPHGTNKSFTVFSWQSRSCVCVCVCCSVSFTVSAICRDKMYSTRLRSGRALWCQRATIPLDNITLADVTHWLYYMYIYGSIVVNVYIVRDLTSNGPAWSWSIGVVNREPLQASIFFWFWDEWLWAERGICYCMLSLRYVTYTIQVNFLWHSSSPRLPR